MTLEGIRVSPEWLSLRESADLAARAPELVARLQAEAPVGGYSVIHDLAAGTGSMGRWLAPLLPGPQRWVLHDRDPVLLSVAVSDPPSQTANGAALAIATQHSDITRLQPADLADATLITASALLDLLTADELAGLIEVCVAVGCPVLLTLSVVGHVELTPPDPFDIRVAAAFDAHQRRRTPGGRLLGPDAVAIAVEGFGRHRAEVLVSPSPWRLAVDQADLAAEWFTGWIGAACESDAALAREAGPYADRRLSEIRTGVLAVVVDHADLLALP